MTLCIAAVCAEGEETRLVLCSDHKIGTWAAQAEIGFKFSWIARNWPALVSGDLSMTAELVATLMGTLDSSSFTRYNVFDLIKAGANAFREKLADNIVRTKLSVSYDYLRQNRSKFPSQTVYEVYSQIAQIDSGAELIAAGFIKDRAYIFVIEKDCSVSYREHFAAIGTGAYIAEPALFQRKQRSVEDLEDTIYRVYEAKKLGQIAEGVGEQTTIAIISASPTPDHTEPIGVRWVTSDGFKFLDAKYKEYGLRAISNVQLPKGSLRDEVFQEEEPEE
jgi:hypothetical protein